ncbi:MAG: 3-isopropylmalate dehydratase small subunit, partial [Pseudomonadota bacterium]
MEKFDTLTARAAPLSTPNIDTDQLIPKQFLKIVTRTGLGDKLLFDQRFDEAGEERPDFVLNRPAYRGAGVIVAGDNFGCGSSREHAVWALMDYGVRCVVATSFSDIFSGNAIKNGLLPAVVSSDDAAALTTAAEESQGVEFSVDLEAQTISAPGLKVEFKIDPFAKAKLLAGLD